MRDNNNNPQSAIAAKTYSPEEIVQELTAFDSAENAAEDLHDMFLAFFMYYDNPPLEWKENIFSTYTQMRRVLNMVNHLRIED